MARTTVMTSRVRASGAAVLDASPPRYVRERVRQKITYKHVRHHVKGV